MRRQTRVLTFLMVVVLVVGLLTSVAFAENDDPQPSEIPAEETMDPTPTPIPTQAPTPEPTQKPTKAPEPTKTVAPTAEPTQAPTAEPTQAPAPEAGNVDITFTCYVGGKAAAGYTMQLGNSTQAADSYGRVTFDGVSVAQQDIKLTDPNGNSSVGVLYLSRGSSTVMTDQAMGGKYGVNIASGVSKIYMDAVFNKGEAIGIKNLSESEPPKPDPVETEASALPSQTAGADGTYETKRLTATFQDADGKAIGGLEVVVMPDGGSETHDVADGSGKVLLLDFAYGSSTWQFTDYSSFTLNMRKGVQTTLINGTDGAFEASVSPRAQQVYLTFKQNGDAFELVEVSESAGGMSIGVLVLIIVIVVVVVIVTIVMVRKNRQKAYAMKNAPKTAGPVAPSKRTGGANKFDDRSRM